MSSRRRNFCFLNLLNLALSPFCDDICPRSSNLFVTQRAEDKSVRSSIRQAATDERCEAQSTLRRNPLQRLRVRLLGLLLAADKMSCGMPAAYSIFRKICHVVADSETWPAQRAVARFPRNGVSATRIRHRLNLHKMGLVAMECCHCVQHYAAPGGIPEELLILPPGAIQSCHLIRSGLDCQIPLSAAAWRFQSEKQAVRCGLPVIRPHRWTSYNWPACSGDFCRLEHSLDEAEVSLSW
jgi:hypothetical protein